MIGVEVEVDIEVNIHLIDWTQRNQSSENLLPKIFEQNSALHQSERNKGMTDLEQISV